jgi:pseudouridine kinase
VDRPDHLGQSVSGDERSSILCIGGAVVDRLYEADLALSLHSSNPVRGRKSHGGVARNAAEVVARLGGRPKLASVAGEDEQGLDLLAQCRSAGIDVSLTQLLPEARTAEYISVFQGCELFAAFADMEIFDNLTASFVRSGLANAGTVDGVFADCNLSNAGLRELTIICEARNLPLAVETVSIAKAKRLGDLVGGIDMLFTNRHEGEVLTCEKESHGIVAALLERGAAAVVVSDGANGVWAGDEKGSFHLAMSSEAVVNVSGAGDALAAGTFLRRLEGAELLEAVAFGMGCAQAALQWPSARPLGFDRREAERRSKTIAGHQRC